MLHKELEQLGFTKNESTVYISLFELGKVKAGELIKATGMHRNSIYTVLDELIKRGLVTKVVEHKIAEFVANDPQALLRELDAKKLLAEDTIQELNKRKPKVNREISIKDDVVQLCEKVLDEGEDLYLIGANGKIMNNHAKYYRKFTDERIKKNMTLHMLAHKNIKGTEFSELFLSKIKYLSSTIESPMVIWIFGDYVANVMWDDPETIFLIRDAKVADSYRSYYNALSTKK